MPWRRLKTGTGLWTRHRSSRPRRAGSCHLAVAALALLFGAAGVDRAVELVVRELALDVALRRLKLAGVDQARFLCQCRGIESVEIELGLLGLRGWSGLLGLFRGFHRLELLFGRKLATLGNDERSYLDGDVLEELDRNLVAADPLDRVAPDLAPVDAHLVLLPQLVRDVGCRDGAEERAGRSRLHVEAKLHLAEPLGDRLCVFEGLCLVLGAPILDLAHFRDPCRSRLVGKTAREEEVARVAARDADDLPAETDLVDVLTEDDFHYLSAT